MIQKGFALLFLAGALSVGAPVRAAVFNPELYTLANGMRVVVVNNRLSDAVVQMVWYGVGALDDPAGKTGSAHFLEHLMFKGTDKVPDGAFSSAIAAMGGEDNAFTTQDSTAYYVTVSRQNLATAMMMEADRMRGLVIDEQAARTELDVVRSERQERTDNKPQGLFEEKMRAALFGDHPYGRPVIGWPQDLAQMTPADARAFYKKYYAPENAVLVLSGNVTGGEALQLASATFGRLDGGATRIASKTAWPKPPKGPTIVMREARIKQPLWTKRVIVASVREEARKAAALEVLSEVLSGGEVGKLYRHFVMGKQTASAIDVSYDSTARGPAVFSIVAAPTGTQGAQALARDVGKMLRQWAAQGIEPQSVEQAKQRMQDSAIFARDRLMAPAQILGEALATGGSLKDVESWPESVRAVTKEEVDQALRDLVESKYSVEGFLLPQERAEATR